MSKIFLLILFTLGLTLTLHSTWLFLDAKIHLGTVLPFVFGLSFCFYAIFSQSIQIFLTKHVYLALLFKISMIGYCLWLVSLLVFSLYLAKNIAPHTLNQPVQAIIVLGSGIQGNQPAPTLKQRLDTAGIIAQQHTQNKIVLTGGLGYAETYTEAEVGARYLQQHYALPKQRLLLEEHSTSTELNLIYSIPLLKQAHIPLTAPIAIVTSDFHTVRAAAIAKKLGYQQVYMVSAETPLSIRYNAWLREYFAYWSGWLLNEY